MGNTHATLVALFEAYAKSTGYSIKTVSRFASGSGATIERLYRRQNITFERAVRIIQWFSDRWPADTKWPADTYRPGPTSDSPAAQAKPPAGDSVKAVQALIERVNTLMDAAAHDEGIDWPAVTAAKTEMLEVAMRLRDDGQIASPIVLCLALGVERRVYDDVVHLYAGGRSGSKRPRGEDTDRRRVFDVLIDAGDVRFAARRPRAHERRQSDDARPTDSTQRRPRHGTHGSRDHR